MTSKSPASELALRHEQAAATAGAAREEPAPAPRPLLPELQSRLELLRPEEQSVLASMIARVKEAASDSEPFDAVSFLHQYLKADPGSADLAASEQEVASAIAPPTVKDFEGAETIPLPTDHAPMDVPLGELLKSRFSSRNYGPGPLSLQTVSSLLHYAYGVKRFVRAYRVRRFPVRMAPSAGGLQPIDLYLVANEVTGLKQGLYYFDPLQHALRLVDQGNFRQRVFHGSIFQDWILYAPLVFVMVCNMPRVFWKYRARGYRFVHADAGVLAQNLYLVATTLRLNTCAVAAFYDDRIHELLGIDGRKEFALLLFVVGNKPQSRAHEPGRVLPPTPSP